MLNLRVWLKVILFVFATLLFKLLEEATHGPHNINNVWVASKEEDSRCGLPIGSTVTYKVCLVTCRIMALWYVDKH
jgi:hypothetical protein